MLKKSASALKRVCLVRLVHLVDLVQPNKPEKPDEPDKPDLTRPSRLSCAAIRQAGLVVPSLLTCYLQEDLLIQGISPGSLLNPSCQILEVFSALSPSID